MKQVTFTDSSGNTIHQADVEFPERGGSPFVPRIAIWNKRQFWLKHASPNYVYEECRLELPEILVIHDDNATADPPPLLGSDDAQIDKDGTTKYKLLTDQQKAAYLADSGRCPYCGENGVEGDEVECEGDRHYQNIQCNACGLDWVDVYTLTEIKECVQTCDECGETIREGEEIEANDIAGFQHTKCAQKD